jgi:hypothetical protein
VFAGSVGTSVTTFVASAVSTAGSSVFTSVAASVGAPVTVPVAISSVGTSMTTSPGFSFAHPPAKSIITSSKDIAAVNAILFLFLLVWSLFLFVLIIFFSSSFSAARDFPARRVLIRRYYTPPGANPQPNHAFSRLRPYGGGKITAAFPPFDHLRPYGKGINTAAFPLLTICGRTAKEKLRPHFRF